MRPPGIAPGGKPDPSGVHYIGKKLRRVGSSNWLCSSPQRVEDKADFKPEDWQYTEVFQATPQLS